jgi:hypothetical protein
MTLIGRMKSLKIMKFHKDFNLTIGPDGFKFMQKGFKYFQDNGGSLTKIQFNNQILGAASQEYF